MPHPWAHRPLVVVLLGALVLVGAPTRSAASSEPDRPDVTTLGPLVADDAWLASADGLVIRPARGRTARVASNAVAGLVRAEAALGRPVGNGFQRIDLAEPLPIDELEAIADELVADGLAVSAEPDYRVVPLAAPNDPYYGYQWHLHGHGKDNTPHGIDVERGWQHTTGSADVVVAVLDSGSRAHPDIVDRLVPGYDMISDPEAARDGDGRDDDATDEGDWVTSDDGCGPARGSSWHGLHVAGTIGASTGNAMGVAGVDQRARIQHVRVLGRCGGEMSDVADAIIWAAGGQVAGVPANATPAHVINLSLGSAKACSSTLQAAVDTAVDRGAVVVAAAGNAATDAAGSPAGCDGVIAVAATTVAGERASYSNFGSWVDIAAPGGDTDGGVLSTHHTSASDPGAGSWSYALMAGTSMAAPHVSGVASLLLATDSDLAPADVEAILRSTARDFPPASSSDRQCSSQPTSDRHCGAGIVDAGAAVAAAAAGLPDTTPPAAPALDAANGDLRITLSWDQVADPSMPITYRLYRRTGGSCATSGTPLFTTQTATSYSDRGVSHGVTYRYCMTATDAAGNTSATSNTRSVTARDTSAPPAPLVLASPGDRRIDVSWSAVTDPTGPITYRLRRSTSSTCSTSSPTVYEGTKRTFTDTGLSRSSSYRYCLTGTDGAGNRSPVASTTWRTVPSACPGYAFVGDWDGSGRDGLGWWCEGRTRLRTASGQIHEFRYGRAGDVPIVADWNGDGRDTVSVIRDGTWHINNDLQGGAAERTFVYGRVSRGDVPIAGSWVAGRTDLPGIIRDTEWHLRSSQSGGVATWNFVYGRLTRGDRPLWGDWNGDGRDTVGIVREGQWHLRNSHAGGAADLTYVYGRVLAGDRPVVGDWTGDGIDTPGIVRDGQWHLRHSHSGGAADQVVTFPAP